MEVFAVKNTVRDITKMVKKIQRKAPDEVRFCYEAGVCGFTLKRRIEGLGSPCMVIAPSLVPVKQGDRIKTDRRDARKLLGPSRRVCTAHHHSRSNMAIWVSVQISGHKRCNRA